MTDPLGPIATERNPSLPIALAAVLQVADAGGVMGFGDLAVAYRERHLELARRAGLERTTQLDGLEPRATVTDLVYSPLMTQFLIEAQETGCTVVDGLGMLLHQAAPGFERWFGIRPEVDDETRRAVLGA